MAVNSDFAIENESLTSIVESIITGVCIFALADNRKLIPVYLNEGLYRMLGYSHKELDRMLKDVRLSIIPDDLPLFEEGLDSIMKDDGAVDFEFRTVTGDGGIRWLQVRANLYGKMEGYPLIAGVVIDCTERKSAQEELALQAERLNILHSSIKEHFVDYNSRTDVLNIRLDNSAYQHKELIVKDFMSSYDFHTVHADERQIFKDIITAARRTQMTDSIDFRSTILEGGNTDFHWYRATLSSVRGADGYVSRIVGRIVNIDAEKKKELELRLKADKDALTGLYNKATAITLITDSIKQCLTDGQKAAMIMIDLDHFKEVNDTFGHAAGDMILEEVGHKLSDTFKGRDIVGRMGGDEFLVFMTDIKGAEDAMGISAKLNKLLTRPLVQSSGSVTVTASIGVAVLENAADLIGNDPDFPREKSADECTCEKFLYEKLFSRADKALYVTKENGRNGVTLYHEEEP